MADTSSPKKVLFGLESIQISYISTRNIIVKGVANHASKAYEFSHFLPYANLVQSEPPFERKGKFILPFEYDNVSINVSDSKYEVDDQVE